MSVDGQGPYVNSANRLVATGGIVSTGVYSCSFAFTGSADLTRLYDVWFTGSLQTLAAFSDSATRFHTGSIIPETLVPSQIKTRPTYYMNITNLKINIEITKLQEWSCMFAKRLVSNDLY